MVRNASEGVIGISGKNPHYFQYKGKEILLITSAEHYGAIISKKFDYVKYLDKLEKYGLNYTRIYPGPSVECSGKWSEEDNMAPGEDLIVPWARSDIPGYHGGGNKFDLDKWDTEYFTRLRDFIEQAGKRGIFVEICFFNCEYPDFWEFSPFHKSANIQGVGETDHIGFQTLDDEPLVREQLRYIEKIIIETNKYDNIIYEFVDEPTLYLTPSQKAYQWISVLIDKAIETEAKLPKKHMLAQQLETGVDFTDDDRIAVIVTQYIGLNARQVGGVPALNNHYCYNKPIECNEMAYVPSWYDYEHAAIARLESWEFMVGGGAAFNQLNGYFIVSNPAGDNEDNHKILENFKNLMAFMDGFDFASMTRDKATVRKVSVGAKVNMISDIGREYVMYMHHSMPNIGHFADNRYEPNYGKYEPKITVLLEKGDYTALFIEPETLKVLKEQSISSDGGEVEIVCPMYMLDIAVKITAK